MQDKLKDLVVAAVRLAIVRHGLITRYDPDVDDEDAQMIAEDTWEALNGRQTCSGEVADEVKALIAMEDRA